MFQLCDGVGSGSGMTNKRNTSITRRIAAASAVAVLSLGAAACGSDGGTDNLDNPLDGVDNTLDDMMPETTDDMMTDTTDDMMTDTTDDMMTDTTDG